LEQIANDFDEINKKKEEVIANKAELQVKAESSQAQRELEERKANLAKIKKKAKKNLKQGLKSYLYVNLKYPPKKII
jgi:hypothetical protein